MDPYQAYPNYNTYTTGQAPGGTHSYERSNQDSAGHFQYEQQDVYHNDNTYFFSTTIGQHSSTGHYYHTQEYSVVGEVPLAEVRILPNPGRMYESSYHGHQQPLVKRNRSTSVASNGSHPYASSRHHSTFSTPHVTGPRPTKKLVYNDPQCVMRSSNGSPIGPSNHIIVPQLPFVENSRTDLGVRQKSIPFRAVGFPELGVKVSKVLNQPVELEGGDDVILDREYKFVKIRIVWPGYKPFEKRVKTRETRSMVLVQTCRVIEDFIKDVEKYKTPTEPGFEDWEVGKRPLIGLRELLITGLIHRGAANWQPEIWCPTYRGD